MAGIYQGQWMGQEIDAAIGRASYISNNNLLDNACFVGGGSQNNSGMLPINQRGQTSYSGAGYGIDRWKITNANFGMELKSDCLRLKCITPIASGNNIFCGFFPTVKLPAGTYTISFLTKGNSGGRWYYSSNGTNGYNIGNPPLSELSYRTFTATGTETQPNFFVWEQGAVASGDYVDIIAAKLEVGTQQTLAHQENGVWVLNEIPDFQTELRKCQRWYWTSNASGSKVLHTVANHTDNTANSILYPLIVLPVEMAGTPTVDATVHSIRSNGSNYNSNLSVDATPFQINSNQMFLKVTASSATFPAYTSGYCVLFSKLNLSAEP